MKLKIFSLIALLCLGSFAMAERQVVSLAYEIALSEFREPATPSGGVTFRECDNCVEKNVRVTTGTSYSVNGRPVTFEKFRESISSISDREGSTVIVLHHLESDTVVSINVSAK